MDACARAPVAAQQRSSAPGRFELHGRGALRRAVSSLEARARSNMSSFARWNQPLMPIALHNSGQNRLQIKMAKGLGRLSRALLDVAARASRRRRVYRAERVLSRSKCRVLGAIEVATSARQRPRSAS